MSGARLIQLPQPPLASGANEIPISTGAGRVYAAQSLATLLGGGVPWDACVPPEALTTSDATPTTIATLDASTWTHARVHVSASAALDDETSGCAWELFAQVLNAAGTVSVSTPHQAQRTNSVAPVDAWEVSMVASGTDVLVQVTGQAATTINWTVSATVVLGA